MKLQYLDLSTAHLSKTTVAVLESVSCNGITVANYEYGVFVSVPSALDDINNLDCPDDLKRVLNHARDEGCDVVRFDADGDFVEQLPKFNW